MLAPVVGELRQLTAEIVHDCLGLPFAPVRALVDIPAEHEGFIHAPLSPVELEDLAYRGALLVIVVRPQGGDDLRDLVTALYREVHVGSGGIGV